MSSVGEKEVRTQKRVVEFFLDTLKGTQRRTVLLPVVSARIEIACPAPDKCLSGVTILRRGRLGCTAHKDRICGGEQELMGFPAEGGWATLFSPFFVSFG